MDIDENYTIRKQCYKSEKDVLDNLNISYNASTSNVVLWNKFEIYLYENLQLDALSKIYIAEFEIHDTVVANNFIVCLDCNDNVHLWLQRKKKEPCSKRHKPAFRIKEKSIKAFKKYNEDFILCMKYVTDSHFLCLHRINADFQIEKSVLLKFDELWPPEGSTKDRYLLYTIPLSVDDLQIIFFSHMKEKLDFKITKGGCDLLLFSLDRYTVYACLFSMEMSINEISPVKLYSCSAEICNIQTIKENELYLLIGLKLGTVIRLSFNDITKKPDIVHLNTALYKIAYIDSVLLYTDGSTMWKTENTFSNQIKFTQLFVKNVKDFEKCGELILCTTFAKLNYTFSIDDKNIFVTPATEETYYPARKLLDNMDWISKIFEESERNEDIIRRIDEEKNFIAALSLSNREDVMDKAIQTHITIYESYSELQESELTLTEEMSHYFQSDTWLLLIKLSKRNTYNVLNSILSNILLDIHIYLTLSTEDKILKTTSITTVETLKSTNYLVPFKLNNFVKDLYLNIKIVMKVPGPLDNKQKLWTILYRKNYIFTAKDFIKTKNKSLNTNLKCPKESIKELIHKINLNQYGNNFKFTSYYKYNAKQVSFYVKLPNNYEQRFNTDRSNTYMSESRSKSLTHLLCSEDFLKSNTSIILLVGDTKVKLKIQDDHISNPVLEVSCENIVIALNIRNHLTNVIYKDYADCKPGQEFLSRTFYTTVENLQTAVKNYVKDSSDYEEFSQLRDHFEKIIIGSLPL